MPKNTILDRYKNNCEKESDDFKKIEKVLGVYRRYNKNSYVRLTDITTISKLRIERINKFDPSGSIRIPSFQMKEISDELMKLYISSN